MFKKAWDNPEAHNPAIRHALFQQGGDSVDPFYNPGNGYIAGPGGSFIRPGASGNPTKPANAPAAPVAAPAAPAMPDFMAIFAMQQEAQAQAQREAEERAEAKAEENRIKQGGKDLQSAFGGYMDASMEATDYVNNLIGQERSNAALLGINFNITDEQKAQRISDRFATIYGEDAWRQMQNLNDEFGDPENPLEFLIERGVATEDTDDNGPATTDPDSKGKVGDTRSNSLLATDDVVPHNPTILGG